MQLPIGPFALDLYDLDISRRQLGYQVTSITRIHKDDTAVVNDFCGSGLSCLKGNLSTTINHKNYVLLMGTLLLDYLVHSYLFVTSGLLCMHPRSSH